MQYGLNTHGKWDVDDETLITLHDMSKLQEEYAKNGEREKLSVLQKDLKTVMKLGKQIKDQFAEKSFKNAKQEFKEIKDINDQIRFLQ